MVNHLQHSDRCKILIQTINKHDFSRTCLERLINFYHNQGIAVPIANIFSELIKRRILVLKKKEEHKRFCAI